MSSFLGIKDLRFFSVEDEGMTESQTLFWKSVFIFYWLITTKPLAI